MPSKKKNKKHLTLPSKISTPKAVPVYLGSPNLEGKHLAWRFSSADIDGAYSCGNFDLADFSALWERLRSFEKMNVDQLRKAESFHKKPTVNLPREFKQRLQEIRLDDIDALYSFRIDGSCRLWCMRYENILSLLWWDREHDACPVIKRNT